MKLRVQLKAEAILNFPNLFDERMEVEKFIHELTKNIVELNELPEWDLRFIFLLGKGSTVGVSKKGYVYTSQPPEKLYYIYIPIPTNEEIAWGVRKKDFVARPPLDEEKLMDRVEGKVFSEFNSLSSYIVENSKKGIEQLLKKGISLKGVKIRLNS